MTKIDIHDYLHKYKPMANVTVNLSHFLRYSGDVLEEVEKKDVHLDRRDGSDVILVKRDREESIRESLEMTVRTLDVVFRKRELRKEMLEAMTEALPWVSWLPAKELSVFFEDFSRTTQTCRATGNYEQLLKLINGWKSSAEIYHDPELLNSLTAARKNDKPVALSRPR